MLHSVGCDSYESPLPVPPQGVATILDSHCLPQQCVVPTLHDSLPLTVTQQGGIPTLRDLCLLPAPNWYLLGLQLGVSADELDVIERNYPRDNHMCKAKMFAAGMESMYVHAIVHTVLCAWGEGVMVPELIHVYSRQQ